MVLFVEPFVCKLIYIYCRFYEAVVRLPLQKAQALDPAGDALNEQIDASIREHALAQREICYEIIASALRSLKGDVVQKEFGSAVRPAMSRTAIDQSSRKKYICQIVQLGVQSPDRAFHEYLYRTMIDLGLEDELLEYGGPDLVPFLQSAGREPIQEVIVNTVNFVPNLATVPSYSNGDFLLVYFLETRVCSLQQFAFVPSSSCFSHFCRFKLYLL